MDYWLVMPAAGSGQRFGGPLAKQHLPLAGATVMAITLRLFLADARCRGLVVAMSPDDPQRPVLRAALPPTVAIVDGGAQRSDSVLAALSALSGRAQPADWVLVHDAVRPLLTRADLDRLLAAGATSPHGALLAAPVADTLKSADATQRCERTVPRAGLWRALTPQMFRYRLLCEALAQARAAGREPTDEAQAVEWLGERPLLVAAGDSNLKITTPDDLAVAGAILAARAAASGAAVQ